MAFHQGVGPAIASHGRGVVNSALFAFAVMDHNAG